MIYIYLVPPSIPNLIPTSLPLLIPPSIPPLISPSLPPLIPPSKSHYPRHPWIPLSTQSLSIRYVYFSVNVRLSGVDTSIANIIRKIYLEVFWFLCSVDKIWSTVHSSVLIQLANVVGIIYTYRHFATQFVTIVQCSEYWQSFRSYRCDTSEDFTCEVQHLNTI